MFKKIISFQIVTLLCQILNFLYSVQLARYLSYEERGILGNDLLYLSIGFMVAGAGFNEFIIRAIRDNKTLNLKPILILSISVAVLITQFLYFTKVIQLSFASYLFILFCIPFYYFSTYSMSYIMAIQQDKKVSLIRILTALYTPTICFILFQLGYLNSQSAISFIYFSYILLSILYFFLFKKLNISFFKSSENNKNDIKEIGFNSISTILVAFTFNGDKILISSLLSNEDFAKYLIAISIYTPLVELLASASVVLISKLNINQNVFNRVLIGFGVYFLIFYIVAEYFLGLIPFFFGKKYEYSTAIASHFYIYFFLVVCFKILDYLLRVYVLRYSSYINILLALFLGFGILYTKVFSLSLNLEYISFAMSIVGVVIVSLQLLIYSKYGRPAHSYNN